MKKEFEWGHVSGNLERNSNGTGALASIQLITNSVICYKFKVFIFFINLSLIIMGCLFLKLGNF